MTSNSDKLSSFSITEHTWQHVGISYVGGVGLDFILDDWYNQQIPSATSTSASTNLHIGYHSINSNYEYGGQMAYLRIWSQRTSN